MNAVVPMPVKMTDSVQSSRRGFLRVLAALAPAVGLAGVPARAVPLEVGPTEDPALIDIGRRAVELDVEYVLAHKAQHDARRSFYDLCGPVPESIRIGAGDVVAVSLPESLSAVDARRWRHYAMDAAWLRRMVASRDAKSPEGRQVRRQLKIAKTYEARRETAAKVSGVQAAEERFDAVNAEIGRLVADALRCQPRTCAGLVAVARCLIVAHAPKEPPARLMWLSAEQPLALARSVVRLLDPDAADRALSEEA